jgi:hypothetical protein
MTFAIRTTIIVSDVREHSRTTFGKKDPATGRGYTEQISLGWFVHTNSFGDPFSFSVGLEKPDVKTGDKIEIQLVKVEPPSPPIANEAAQRAASA